MSCNPCNPLHRLASLTISDTLPRSPATATTAGNFKSVPTNSCLLDEEFHHFSQGHSPHLSTWAQPPTDHVCFTSSSYDSNASLDYGDSYADHWARALTLSNQKVVAPVAPVIPVIPVIPMIPMIPMIPLPQPRNGSLGNHSISHHDSLQLQPQSQLQSQLQSQPELQLQLQQIQIQNDPLESAFEAAFESLDCQISQDQIFSSVDPLERKLATVAAAIHDNLSHNSPLIEAKLGNSQFMHFLSKLSSGNITLKDRNFVYVDVIHNISSPINSLASYEFKHTLQNETPDEENIEIINLMETDVLMTNPEDDTIDSDVSEGDGFDDEPSTSLQSYYGI